MTHIVYNNRSGCVRICIKGGNSVKETNLLGIITPPCPDQCTLIGGRCLYLGCNIDDNPDECACPT